MDGVQQGDGFSHSFREARSEARKLPKFAAYRWLHDLTDKQVLERLVAPNAERAAKEKRGLIRWLRPAFQNPRGAKAATPKDLATTDEPETAALGILAAYDAAGARRWKSTRTAA
jgi:hypothetical protein